MKNILLFLALIHTSLVTGQISIDSLFRIADSAYYDYKDYPKALTVYQTLEKQSSISRKDKKYVINKIARIIFSEEAINRKNPTLSIELSKKFIEYVDKNQEELDSVLFGKKYFMYKNIVVGYFALKNLNEAKKYQEKLYGFYKQKLLPEGMKDHYNFEFFKLEDKNVWGYEWFEELPKDRFSSSFTKIVYYIYSTNPDGTDKDQLYRLHVLMFHQDSENAKFDYILEKQIDTKEAVISGSYYQYNYKKDIDYIKLESDVKEIVLKEIEPSSKRVSQKK